MDCSGDNASIPRIIFDTKPFFAVGQGRQRPRPHLPKLELQEGCGGDDHRRRHLQVGYLITIVSFIYQLAEKRGQGTFCWCRSQQEIPMRNSGTADKLALLYYFFSLGCTPTLAVTPSGSGLKGPTLKRFAIFIMFFLCFLGVLCQGTPHTLWLRCQLLTADCVQTRTCTCTCTCTSKKSLFNKYEVWSKYLYYRVDKYISAIFVLSSH